MRECLWSGNGSSNQFLLPKLRLLCILSAPGDVKDDHNLVKRNVNGDVDENVDENDKGDIDKDVRKICLNEVEREEYDVNLEVSVPV